MEGREEINGTDPETLRNATADTGAYSHEWGVPVMDCEDLYQFVPICDRANGDGDREQAEVIAKFLKIYRT